MRTFQNELPRPADAFVDSIGVNAHLGAYGTAYFNNFSAIASLLGGLGVRHVRDGIAFNQPTICDRDKQLAGQGIHFDFTTAADETSAELTAWAACVGSAIESIEGPNEYDLMHPSSDSNWAATLSDFQRRLYTGVKAVSTVPVLGPALTSQNAYASVGDLSSSADGGNVHDYFAGRNPGTGGWGDTDAFGTYGSLAWNIGLARQSTGSKPMYATETGYPDLVGAMLYAVPPATKARYTLRTLLEDWNAGVVRTYVFELLDENTDSFRSYGITDGSGNPKPAYTALKNLIAHLADPGAPISATPLSYTLTAPSSVHHTLLQRRNGSYALVVWVEQPDWNPDTNATIIVPTQTASLNFTAAPHTVTATTFDDSGNVTTAPLSVTNNTVSVTASDNVTIVDITP
jgi:hypothetical protein